MSESPLGSPQGRQQGPLGDALSGPPVAAHRVPPEHVATAAHVATPRRVATAPRLDSDDSHSEPLGRFGHNKVGILATLFLVSGIVGLPLLLLSPAFSRPEKSFWTVAIIIYTVIVFSLFGGFLLWVWDQVGA